VVDTLVAQTRQRVASSRATKEAEGVGRNGTGRREETYYQASDLTPHSSFPQPMEMLGGEVHFHQHIGNEAKDGILYARCIAFP
jgi:hypothetical protein